MHRPVERTRERIHGLGAVPGDPRQVLRAIELARDPVGGGGLVSCVVREPGLAALVLVAAETVDVDVRQATSWIGQEGVRQVVRTHGVRALRASLEVDPLQARNLWAASVCKAAAAARLVRPEDPSNAEVAFTHGLWFDMGLMALAACDGPGLEKILRGNDLPISRQLGLERDHFGLDHAQAGLVCAERLGLPAWRWTPIARHHGQNECDSDPLAAAIQTVALMPHDLRWWPASQHAAWRERLARHHPAWPSPDAVLELIQRDLDEAEDGLPRVDSEHTLIRAHRAA